MELLIGDLVTVRCGARVWSGSPMDDTSIAMERAWSADAYGIVMEKADCPKGMIPLLILGVIGFVEISDVGPVETRVSCTLTR
jgi:hypothetical protein